MWMFFICIAILLYSLLDDLIKVLKSKNPLYQKEQEQKQLEHQQERLELTQHLHELIGLNCLIKSYDLLNTSAKSSEINAQVVTVDDEWVEVLFLKKNKKFNLVIKTAAISSVSKLLS